MSQTMSQKDITQHVFHFFGVFDDFSFSTKGSIECIFVGMERSNGIPTDGITCWKNFCRPEFCYRIDVCYIVDTYTINKTISHKLNFTPIINWYTFDKMTHGSPILNFSF